MAGSILWAPIVPNRSPWVHRASAHPSRHALISFGRASVVRSRSKSSRSWRINRSRTVPPTRYRRCPRSRNRAASGASSARTGSKRGGNIARKATGPPRTPSFGEDRLRQEVGGPGLQLLVANDDRGAVAQGGGTGRRVPSSGWRRHASIVRCAAASVAGPTNPTSPTWCCSTTRWSRRPATSRHGSTRPAPADAARSAPGRCSRPRSNRSSQSGFETIDRLALLETRLREQPTAGRPAPHQTTATAKARRRGRHRSTSVRTPVGQRPRRPRRHPARHAGASGPVDVGRPVDGGIRDHRGGRTRRLPATSRRRSDAATPTASAVPWWPTPSTGCVGAARRRAMVNTAFDNTAALALYESVGFRRRDDSLLILELRLAPLG